MEEEVYSGWVVDTEHNWDSVRLGGWGCQGLGHAFGGGGVGGGRGGE